MVIMGKKRTEVTPDPISRKIVQMIIGLSFWESGVAKTSPNQRTKRHVGIGIGVES